MGTAKDMHIDWRLAKKDVLIGVILATFWWLLSPDLASADTLPPEQHTLVFSGVQIWTLVAGSLVPLASYVLNTLTSGGVERVHSWLCRHHLSFFAAVVMLLAKIGWLESQLLSRLWKFLTRSSIRPRTSLASSMPTVPCLFDGVRCESPSRKSNTVFSISTHANTVDASLVANKLRSAVLLRGNG